MVHSKKNTKTRNRKKNTKTRNRKKNTKTHNRKKNTNTHNRKKTLIGQVGGKPFDFERLLLHVRRDEIKSFDTIEKMFEHQVRYKPSIILDALQSFKIDKFDVQCLINYLKVDNKHIVLSSLKTGTFEYLILRVKDEYLEWAPLSTHKFLQYIDIKNNIPLYAMTDYLWNALDNHILNLGHVPENDEY